MRSKKRAGIQDCIALLDEPPHAQYRRFPGPSILGCGVSILVSPEYIDYKWYGSRFSLGGKARETGHHGFYWGWKLMTVRKKNEVLRLTMRPTSQLWYVSEELFISQIQAIFWIQFFLSIPVALVSLLSIRFVVSVYIYFFILFIRGIDLFFFVSFEFYLVGWVLWELEREYNVKRWRGSGKHLEREKQDQNNIKEGGPGKLLINITHWHAEGPGFPSPHCSNGEWQ